jgi:predicted RNA binding protein YcfA (HicA-like mRNA interferase family)
MGIASLRPSYASCDRVVALPSGCYALPRFWLLLICDEIDMPENRKVLEQIIEGRGTIAFRDFEALLSALGFVLKRQRGSHKIYIHATIARPFPVQPDGRDAKPYQVRQLRDIIRKYRLTLDAGQ